MPANILGVQPLKFGTTTTTGYVVDSTTEDESSEEFTIEDEGGNVVTQITAYGLKSEKTFEVIPKSSVTRPAAGTLITLGGIALNILSVSIKNVKKDVEKWTVKGTVYPGITPG